jgi:hypothetical protein
MGMIALYDTIVRVSFTLGVLTIGYGLTHGWM